jgi:hypothetical protein
VQALANRPAPTPPPAPATPAAIGDDDVVTGREVKTLLQQMQQPVQQNFQGVYQNIAQMNMAQARAQHPKLFEKYGPEIDNYIAHIPVEARTLDNIEQVVKIVRGNHVDEIARDRALEMVNQGDPTLRSNGSFGGQNSNYSPASTGRMTESDELPAEYRQILKDKGISDETLREFFAMNNMDPTKQREWFEKAKKHRASIIVERSRRGD